jgi:hypothetical protein
VIVFACIGDARCLPGSSSPRFVTATVDHFFETGEWPSIRLLQKVLTELEDPADARREARRLPYGHGRRENDHVVLSVRGIYGTEPNHPLLADFEHALHLAAQLYRRGVRRIESTISYRTLIDRYSFTDPQAKRAIALLEAEALVMDAPCGEEIKVILPRIRNFLRVRDVNEYVKKKARLDRKRRIKRLLGKPLDLLRWFGKEEVKIRDKIVAGALATLLATALYLGIDELGSGGDVNRGPTTKLHRQAHEHSRKSEAARSGG